MWPDFGHGTITVLRMEAIPCSKVKYAAHGMLVLYLALLVLQGGAHLPGLRRVVNRGGRAVRSPIDHQM